MAEPVPWFHDRSEAHNEKLETVSLKPTKANIAVKLVSLAWVPQWQDAQGARIPAWQ